MDTLELFSKSIEGFKGSGHRVPNRFDVCTCDRSQEDFVPIPNPNSIRFVHKNHMYYLWRNITTRLVGHFSFEINQETHGPLEVSMRLKMQEETADNIDVMRSSSYLVDNDPAVIDCAIHKKQIRDMEIGLICATLHPVEHIYETYEWGSGQCFSVTFRLNSIEYIPRMTR